jgi:CheY-like chemotaxis protein
MPKRIRMVEAPEDLRGVLRDLLGGSGCAVVEAPDGQDGVANPISA